MLKHNYSCYTLNDCFFMRHRNKQKTQTTTKYILWCIQIVHCGTIIMHVVHYGTGSRDSPALGIGYKSSSLCMIRS